MNLLGALFIALPAAAQLQVTLTPGIDIQQAVSANPTNTTFILEPGVYRQQTIQPKDGDRFIGMPGAILSGAAVLSGFTKSGKLWTTARSNPRGQVNGSCDQDHARCMYPEDLFFDSRPLLHVGSVAAVTAGTWYFDYNAGIIYFADDPTDHTVELSIARSAFRGSANNVAIDGLIVEKYAVPAQFGAIGDQYPGQNWSISNNEVRWNHGTGISLATGSQALSNYVHNNGQKGIGGVGANLVVFGNEISYNNYAGFDLNWEAGGTKFALTTGLILRGNNVHGNLGPGLWADVDCTKSTIENNTVTNNFGGPGIQYEISSSAKIRYNTVRYNYTPDGGWWMWGAQILIQNSSDVEVYGNTVDVLPNQGNAIGIIQQNRGTGPYGPRVSRNNYVHHNTIITRQSPQGATGVVADWDQQTALVTGNNRFDYNNYHVSDVTQYQWAWGTGMTWNGFRSAGQERNGTIDNQLPPPGGESGYQNLMNLRARK